MKQTFLDKLKRKFIRALSRRLPDCEAVTPKLGKALDKELSCRERLIVNLHLFACRKCARYADQIKFIREAFKEKDFQSEEASSKFGGEQLSVETRRRIENALRSAPGTAY